VITSIRRKVSKLSNSLTLERILYVRVVLAAV
jgi:hypothetical protein